MERVIESMGTSGLFTLRPKRRKQLENAKKI
jgi:hypothetical protein